MDLLKDPEMIKLVALLGAFVIGVVVCVYVVIRETFDLKRRRKAKELMYKDSVENTSRCYILCDCVSQSDMIFMIKYCTDPLAILVYSSLIYLIYTETCLQLHCVWYQDSLSDVCSGMLLYDISFIFWSISLYIWFEFPIVNKYFTEELLKSYMIYID